MKVLISYLRNIIRISFLVVEGGWVILVIVDGLRIWDEIIKEIAIFAYRQVLENSIGVTGSRE